MGGLSQGFHMFDLSKTDINWKPLFCSLYVVFGLPQRPQLFFWYSALSERACTKSVFWRELLIIFSVYSLHTVAPTMLNAEPSSHIPMSLILIFAELHQMCSTLATPQNMAHRNYPSWQFKPRSSAVPNGRWDVTLVIMMFLSSACILIGTPKCSDITMCSRVDKSNSTSDNQVKHRPLPVTTVADVLEAAKLTC